MSRLPRMAKLTRPRIFDALPRGRLFERLDQLCRRPALWVSAPAGAGKTTLLASYLDAGARQCLWYQVDSGDVDPATFFYYLGLAANSLRTPGASASLPLLTPEYSVDLPGFSRRFFRELFEALPAGSLLILDNYQDVPADAALHSLVYEAIEQIPAGVNLVALSRHDPPAETSRLIANRTLSRLGANELVLTFDETRAIASQKYPVDDETARALHDKAGGWAAGIVLLLEGGAEAHALKERTGPAPTGTVFDYFASQVFNQSPDEVQSLLLRTAHAPRFTVALAQQLTDDPRAAEIIEALFARNLFIDRVAGTEVAYQYHALFRVFLQAKARARMSHEERSRLARLAGEWLEAAGSYEDAMRLHLDAGHDDSARRLVIEVADKLLGQGRWQTLRGWISALPPSMQTDPWLRYWAAVCEIPLDLGRARRLLESVFEDFGAAQDVMGQLLAAASVVETYYFEWSNFAPLTKWIPILESLLSSKPQFPTLETELRVLSAVLAALTYPSLTHPLANQYAQRCEELLNAELEPNHRIAAATFLRNYYLWAQDLRLAASVSARTRPLLARPGVTRLNHIWWVAMESFYHFLSGNQDACRLEIDHALMAAREEGLVQVEPILVFYATYWRLGFGDAEAARLLLARAEANLDPARLHDMALVHFLRSWLALLDDERSAALHHAELALEYSKPCGFVACNVISDCAIALAQDLAGAPELGLQPARTARARVASLTFSTIHFHAISVEAYVTLRCGHHAQGQELLREAFSIGRERDYTMSAQLTATHMSRLCAWALESDIEPQYVRRLIRARDLRPELQSVDAWPWRLRVRTLGEFAIEVDGQPLAFSTKVPRKLLALVKAIVALGPREVPEAALWMALWADEDGDAAHRAFTTALHRVRKLVGGPSFLTQREARVTLDLTQCWVDVLAFEQHCHAAEQAQAAGDSNRSMKAAEQAIDLYRGNFLAGDPDAAWTFPTRDRLREQFIRTVAGLGRQMEERGLQEQAVSLYLRGLKVDGLAETFYRGLMRCHQQQGRRSESLLVYRRMREMLSATLGIEPSPQSEALYRSIALQ